MPVSARQLLKTRAVWISPLIVTSIVVVLITAFYIGSVVNPAGHLHGLPVAIVNQDRGATIGTQRVDFGQQVQAGLTRSPSIAYLLGLTDTTLRAAEQAMDRDGSYAAVVIPADFTASLLELASEKASGPGYRRPEITILTNQRAGTEGVGLATGVLQPALESASRQIGRKLTASMPAGSASPVTRAYLADPVTVTTTVYRPLPSYTALGLSAFYIALLTLMCGFLGGAIVNSSVDAYLGYATTEIGPRWSQRRPVLISRWQTLIIKWVIGALLAGLTTGLMLLVAAGLFRMDAPHAGLLWLLTWLAAASVAEGTIVLFAVLGASIGQLLAMLLFVYSGLASAGGTVPLQALPVFLRAGPGRPAAADPRRHPGNPVLRRPGQRRADPIRCRRRGRAGLLAGRGHGARALVRPQGTQPHRPADRGIREPSRAAVQVPEHRRSGSGFSSAPRRARAAGRLTPCERNGPWLDPRRSAPFPRSWSRTASTRSSSSSHWHGQVSRPGHLLRLNALFSSR